jgi:phenylacetate-CoA ligase
MTSLAEERLEQQRWTKILRRPEPFYDKLVENEFETPEQYRDRSIRNLRAMLRFASQQVPHYREAFRRANVEATDGDPTKVLTALPLLSKLDVLDAGKALMAENLPPGDVRAHWWQSSGTTGRPLRVLHSKISTNMHPFLAQRSSRWHRLDPLAKFAEMRIPRLLPPRPDGSEPPPGETVKLDAWRDMPDFATGPYVGISVLTPVEDRIAWLRHERPDYLLAYSETLEVLAMAAGNERPEPNIKGVLAISEQLTPSMRSFVERRFGARAHQVYGLSEFGLAAARCDAGRYHVHREHCRVEIVDEQGHACAPGEVGRIVVTGLSNFAMPLIRYDTGDLAEATDGPCPCNRTLPSFGEIVGRYSRIAYLPAGTMVPVLALRETIESMPVEIMQGLREFQIHQYADRRMELRLVAQSPLPEAFFARIRDEWVKATGGGAELSFRSVSEIPKPPGGKSEVFTSDFMPARDSRTPTAGAPGSGGAGNV